MATAPMDTNHRDKMHIFSEFLETERQMLINELVRLKPALSKINRGQLFMLWFCDIKRLRKIVRDCRTDPDWWAMEMFVTLLQQENRVDLAGIWAGKCLPEPRPRENPSKASVREGRPICPTKIPQPASLARSRSPQKQSTPDRLRNEPGAVSISNPSKRDTAARELAMDRDNDQCVLTKQGLPLLEVAHIIPNKLHKKNRCVDWGLLRIFWGKERVEEWQREISQQPNQPEIINTEQVQNLMTLSTQVHGYWDRCVCAFRPIEVNPERTEMTISFHWLPLRDEGMKAADSVPTDRNPYGRGHQGFDETPGNGNFVHTEGKEFITSGYIFTVTTDDPREKPLPSFALLNLQWHLHRIAAMKGAAEEYDSEIESDGDDISVRSGSRSPVKESLAERLAENLPPPTSRNRSLSPKKIQDLYILEENPGELVE